MSNYLENIAELEKNYLDIIWICLSAAANPEELTEMIQQRVFGEVEFNSMPQRNKRFIEGYAAAAVRIYGKLRDSMRPGKNDEPLPHVVALQPHASWRRHTNPDGSIGGWISDTAFADETAKIGAHAVVYGNARVLDRSQVYGSAKVGDNAILQGNPHVHGRAVVGGSAKILDAARVLGDVTIAGKVMVAGKSVVRGRMTLEGSEEIIDRTVASLEDVHSNSKRRNSGIWNLDSKTG